MTHSTTIPTISVAFWDRETVTSAPAAAIPASACGGGGMALPSGTRPWFSSWSSCMMVGLKQPCAWRSSTFQGGYRLAKKTWYSLSDRGLPGARGTGGAAVDIGKVSSPRGRRQAGLNPPERGQVLGGNKGAAGGVACSRLLVLSRAPGPVSLRSRSINDLCRVPGEPGALGQKGEKK